MKARAGPPTANRLISRLSEDLTDRFGAGFSAYQLWDMRRFYPTHKKMRPAAESGWTQHVALMRIGDVRKRKSLEEKAIREVLSRDDVRKLIHAGLVRKQVETNLSAVPRTPSAPGAFHALPGHNTP